MLAKSWKRIGLIILIIACIWNVSSKLIGVTSFNTALEVFKSKIQVIQEDKK